MFIFALIGLLAIESCQEASVSPWSNKDSKVQLPIEYYPMEIGDAWTYFYTSSMNPTRTDIIIFQITDKILLDNNITAKVLSKYIVFAGVWALSETWAIWRKDDLIYKAPIDTQYSSVDTNVIFIDCKINMDTITPWPATLKYNEQTLSYQAYYDTAKFVSRTNQQGYETVNMIVSNIFNTSDNQTIVSYYKPYVGMTYQTITHTDRSPVEVEVYTLTSHTLNPPVE